MRVFSLIIFLIACSFCNIVLAETENLYMPKVHTIKKDNFEFELQLFNGENLPSLIPAIPQYKSNKKYVFGCIRNLTDRVGYLTFEVFSPNNSSLNSDRVTISMIESHVYFLLWLNSPYMHTNEEDVKFDVKIIKSTFKP